MALRRWTGCCHEPAVPALLPAGVKESQREARMQPIHGASTFPRLPTPVPQLPRHGFFFLAAVVTAFVIKLCIFPQLRSTPTTFTSQRRIWVQSGLRAEHGPGWFALCAHEFLRETEWLLLGVEMELSGDQGLRTRKAFNPLCPEARFAEQAERWSERGP